ncbi:MAG: sugar phosphate isomerase/epimerase family protein [Flavobacteriaceae bacterium]
MTHKISRREAIGNSLKVSLAALGGYAFTSGIPGLRATKTLEPKKELPFRISLNTSTLLHYKLSVDEQIDMVADAGFDGIELWMSDVKAYLEQGGSLQTLKDKLEARQLVLEDMIGFARWCSEDAEERKAALDQMREEMDITTGLGGKYIATPILGLETLECGKFDDYVERYKAILELGDETGVTPLLELWGMGVLHKLADCAQIVIATGHPKATILLDFYHIYRGGNDWDTVDCLNGKRLPVIHMNDYPASPARELLKDSDRTFPGEGICDFGTAIPKLYAAGFRGGFAVELFNPGYWETMDAKTILKHSYEKTHEVLEKAMAGTVY